MSVEARPAFRGLPRCQKQSILGLWEPWEHMTEGDMVAAVAELPDDLRAELARGPRMARFGCAVCDVLGVHKMTKEDDGRSDPVYVVSAYHEVPKLHMQTADDQWYGEAANEVYRRCIQIYRAAGWTGEAQEPNA